MKPLKNNIHFTAIVLILIFPFISGAQSDEQPKSPNNLITKSPFLPPGYGIKPEEPAPVEAPKPVIVGQLSRDLEFRGIFQMGETPPKFSIFDKKEQKGHWIELNGKTDRFEVVDYDKDSGTITVSSGEQREELFMSKPNDSPLSISGDPSTRGNSTLNQNNRPQIEPNPRQRNGRAVPRRRVIRRRTPREPPRANNNLNVEPPPPPN